MRLTALFMLISVGVSHATSLYSQSTHLTVNATNKTVKEVFNEIEQNSEYIFFYYDEVLDVNRKVNVHAEKQTVDKILDQLFESTNNTYVIDDRQIFISRKESVIKTENTAIKQQSKTITGIVKDDMGEPLIGVNIQVKGTTSGTITNIDGEFTLSVNQSNPVLIISYIGYKAQEIPTGSQQHINIILKPDALGLDEVVVVGYGSVKKQDLTGSVSSVKLADIDRQPVIRIEDALKGQAGGVQIQKQNAAPGAGIKIRIRGANSVNGNNEPLYVIDGFVGGDFASLNPNDIESINILKDASATAVYGSRGSNGVVMVTTKQAKEGESRVEYNGFVSFDRASKKVDLLSAAEYMEVANARQDAFGQQHYFSQAEIDEMRRTGGVDYQDEVLRTGITQNHQLSVAGGTQKIKYFLSGSFVDQQGIIENSYYKRYGLRANINSEIAKRVDMAFNLYGTYTESRNNYAYDGRSTVYGSSLIYPRNIPIYDDAGGYSVFASGIWSDYR